MSAKLPPNGETGLPAGLAARQGGDPVTAGSGGQFIGGGAGGDNHDPCALSNPRVAAARMTCDPANKENVLVRFPQPGGSVTVAPTFRNIETVVPSFTPGTSIATPEGEVPVETIKVGDRVITRDNGIRVVRRVGRRDLTFAELQAAQHLRPVLIEQGALGNGLPERDMLVSPNHRMLIANDRTALYFEESEVLVAAKHITSARGVRTVDVLGVTYIHFMCDRHEVVMANGAWTEIFQPDDPSLGAVGHSQRAETVELFPEFASPSGAVGYPLARKAVRRREAMLLEFSR